MPNQVVWPKCNVFDDVGNPTVLKRGEYLPDGVDDVQLETLRIIGAVRPVDFAPSAEDSGEPTESEVESGTPDMLQKPSPEDSKAAWVEYASDERNPGRMSRTEANSMSKQALMDRFKG
jgi:hypothetical protein